MTPLTHLIANTHANLPWLTWRRYLRQPGLPWPQINLLLPWLHWLPWSRIHMSISLTHLMQILTLSRTPLTSNKLASPMTPLTPLIANTHVNLPWLTWRRYLRQPSWTPLTTNKLDTPMTSLTPMIVNTQVILPWLAWRTQLFAFSSRKTPYRTKQVPLIFITSADETR